jgi:hypothetical protein
VAVLLTVTSVWKIDEYIPDALYDSWETVRDLAIEWMIKQSPAARPPQTDHVSDHIPWTPTVLDHPRAGRTWTWDLRADPS